MFCSCFVIVLAVTLFVVLIFIFVAAIVVAIVQLLLNTTHFSRQESVLHPI